MTYPEFREQEEEIKATARERFREHCDEEALFKFFWFGIEFRAVGRDYDACPFSSSKQRGAFLAGMEWFDNFSGGDDCISPERIEGLSKLNG